MEIMSSKCADMEIELDLENEENTNSLEDYLLGDMPKNYRPLLLREVDEYLAWLEERKRAPTTLVDYGYTFNQFYRFCRDTEGLSAIPDEVGKKELLAFYNMRKQEIGKKYLQTQYRQLKGFYKHLKGNNEIFEDIAMRFSRPSRPNVTWLDDEEVENLLDSINTPLEDMLIHLGLELGIRRVGIHRLEVDSFDRVAKTIDVCGKGFDDGKWRTLPFHPETERILDAWLKEREKIVTRARKRKQNPNLDSEHLAIYFNNAWGLNHYGPNGLALVLKRVVKRAGITKSPCAFHALRRTFGRKLYDNGIELAKIAELYGHSDTRTTLLYVGINIKDMAEALEQGALFRRNRPPNTPPSDGENHQNSKGNFGGASQS